MLLHSPQPSKTTTMWLSDVTWTTNWRHYLMLYCKIPGACKSLFYLHSSTHLNVLKKSIHTSTWHFSLQPESSYASLRSFLVRHFSKLRPRFGSFQILVANLLHSFCSCAGWHVLLHGNLQKVWVGCTTLYTAYSFEYVYLSKIQWFFRNKNYNHPFSSLQVHTSLSVFPLYYSACLKDCPMNESYYDQTRVLRF